MGVGERPQSIILFLACSIPQSEVDHFAIDLDGGCVIVKDSGHVLGGELVLSVAV